MKNIRRKRHWAAVIVLAVICAATWFTTRPQFYVSPVPRPIDPNRPLAYVCRLSEREINILREAFTAQYAPGQTTVRPNSSNPEVLPPLRIDALWVERHVRIAESRANGKQGSVLYEERSRFDEETLMDAMLLVVQPEDWQQNPPQGKRASVWSSIRYTLCAKTQRGPWRQCLINFGSGGSMDSFDRWYGQRFSEAFVNADHPWFLDLCGKNAE